MNALGSTFTEAMILLIDLFGMFTKKRVEFIELAGKVFATFLQNLSAKSVTDSSMYPCGERQER